MRPLHPHLPFDPEETCLSFANRLSLLHTGCGMEPLLRDLRIDVSSFLSGRKDEADELALASAVSLDALSVNRVDVKPRDAWFRGKRQSKSFLSARAARYCPACLAEDGDSTSWRHQLIWGVRHVYRCDRHNIWLNTSADNLSRALHGMITEENLREQRNAHQPSPENMAWFRSSLYERVSAENGWLAEQSLEQVLNASEMLGAVLEHGHDVRPTTLPPDVREEAIDIGFSIYREGPRAVAEALNTIHGTSPASAVQAGPLVYYGTLFDWLDRRSNAIDPGPIRNILRQHIVRNFAIEPGAAVLGEVISVRKPYTLQSLSEELGMDRRRLFRLLQKIGKVPFGATDKESGTMIFDAVDTLPLVEAFQSAVSLHDVPTYLGASKRQVENLYREKVLNPLIPTASRGAVRNVVFARSHLDELMAKIDRLPIIAEGDRARYYSLAHACQRGAGRFAGSSRKS